MKKFAEIFLGILTAMGGFVEIGELTFTLNAGTHFGYQLLWVVAVGTLGIMVYCEMAGRVAAVRHRAVFNLIRERAGFSAGLATLIAANIVCLLTCAAEIGGVALVWELLSDWPYRLWLAVALIFLLLVVWLLPFEWIERIFGLGGLLMIVFIVTLICIHPDWKAMTRGLIPTVPKQGGEQMRLYLYYAVALASSIMLPYETYFYASGGVEDGWKPNDYRLNRVIVLIGFSLGGILSATLVGLGVEFFARHRIDPQLPGTAAFAPALLFGNVGLIIAVLGMFFAFAGAAIETSLSAAYNLAQFIGWPWGKYKSPREAGRFSLSWIIVFAVGTLIVLTGVDPVQVVEYSIIFSVIILPFTYFPVLVIASDKRIMGEHVNGPVANVLGWSFLVIITLAALAAIPLFVLTHGGQG